MRAHRITAFLLVMFAFGLPATARATEYSSGVKVSRIDVFTNGGGGKIYYFFPDRPWGFASCPTDQGYITLTSSDSNIGAANKDILVVALTAKVTGALFIPVVDSCTSRVIIQAGVQ